MTFDSTERKRLLYADLFKGYNRGKREIKSTILSPNSEGSSQLSAWDSSSSGFSTPFGSELGSSDGEDGDFIAELTRQMAEGMLRDEEEAEEETAGAESLSEESQGCLDSAAAKNLKDGLCPYPVRDSDQVYELKNQPPTPKQAPNTSGRPTRTTELARQKLQNTEQNYRGKEWRSGLGEKGQVGSRMRAIFLRNGSSGTGVYLPRVTNDLVELKKKPGCSTVLIPTRVLEILELHYSNRLSADSSGPSSLVLGAHSPNRFHAKDEWSKTWVQPRRNIESQIEPSSKDVEMQLPREWTY